MPKIVSIYQTKKQKILKRYTIRLDQGEPLYVTAKLLDRNRFQAGQILDEETIKNFQEAAEFEEAKELALNMLDRRVRCRKEIERALRDYPEKIINRVTLFLHDYRLLDDLDYARRYTRDRLRFMPRSLKMIAQELKSKGVENADIQLVISEIGEETDEIAIALKLARKKLRIDRRSSLQTQRQRLYGFLARRGFDYDIIREVLSQTIG